MEMRDLAGWNPGPAMVEVNLIPEIVCAILDQAIARVEDRAGRRLANHILAVARWPAIDRACIRCHLDKRRDGEDSWFLALSSFNTIARRYSQPGQLCIREKAGGSLIFFSVPDFVHRIAGSGSIRLLRHVIVCHARLNVIPRIDCTTVWSGNDTRRSAWPFVQVKEVVVDR